MTPLLNFVIDEPGSALPRFNAVQSMSDCLAREPAIAAGVASRGDLCWSFQTYLHLAERTGLPVACGNELRDDAVNFVHSDQLTRLRSRTSTFIVCMRADFPARRWAQTHIVQNRLQGGGGAFYLPLWPQSGIQPRDPGRRRVERVAYVGQTFNGNLAADETTWRGAVERLGLEFVAPPRERWGDFSSIDVLVGVRSFDGRTYPGKPPSKLINAWHARAPFIGGPDSAYEQIGTPGRDYLRAVTLDEVAHAIALLRDDDAEYARIVANGALKAQRYSVEAMCDRWTALIQAEVLPRYNLWRNRPAYESLRFHALYRVGRIEKRLRACARRALDLTADRRRAGPTQRRVEGSPGR
ncbi:glycosyltransferase [Hansschlegelia beijingensis]|uniref:glycosyltransferase n=1 Tax=Hansschlegelia beijingensis TaxID=1133344 RepID=UPI00387F066D